MEFPKEYLTARSFTRKWEGGFVDHKNDYGGATNKGVIQANYDAYRAGKKLPLRSVKLITEEECNEIYYKGYWMVSKCYLLTPPLTLAVFDTAINFGNGRAKEFLQKALGVEPDRVIGPGTKAAIDKCNPKEIALKICELRIAYRHKRVKQDPSQVVFLKGWLNRDEALKKAL
jgi:lysozyme family protein